VTDRERDSDVLTKSKCCGCLWFRSYKQILDVADFRAKTDKGYPLHGRQQCKSNTCRWAG
jgi:hypothetical protein